MSKQVGKPGKTPIAAKTEDLSDVELLMQTPSILDVDKRLIDALKAKGLEVRWINAKKYMSGGNFHQSGWRALEASEIPDDVRKISRMAVNPDGFIMRNDLILGVKTTDEAKLHKRRLKARADVMAGKDNNRKAELEEALGGAKDGVKIFDGYESNS